MPQVYTLPRPHQARPTDGTAAPAMRQPATPLSADPTCRSAQRRALPQLAAAAIFHRHRMR